METKPVAARCRPIPPPYSLPPTLFESRPCRRHTLPTPESTTPHPRHTPAALVHASPSSASVARQFAPRSSHAASSTLFLHPLKCPAASSSHLLYRTAQTTTGKNASCTHARSPCPTLRKTIPPPLAASTP